MLEFHFHNKTAPEAEDRRSIGPADINMQCARRARRHNPSFQSSADHEDQCDRPHPHRGSLQLWRVVGHRSALAHDGHLHHQGDDRRRHRRLGRRIWARHLRDDAGRVRQSGVAARARPRRRRHRRPDGRPAAQALQFSAQRAGRLCAVRPRHRALGHRRQGRGPAALPHARRQARRTRAGLCEPAALRQGRPRRAQRRARARAGLHARQAARDHRTRSGGGAPRHRPARSS